MAAMDWYRRARVGATALLLVKGPALAQEMRAQPVVEALIRAEDARGAGAGGVAVLIDALRNPVLRASAIRGMGRLERPDLVRHLLPFLGDPQLRTLVADAVAQSLRGIAVARRAGEDRALVDSVAEVLEVALRAERESATVGALARSLARLPFAEARQARSAESVVVGSLPRGVTGAGSVPAAEGVAHGLYTLARLRRTLGDLSPEALEWLKRAAVGSGGIPGAESVRRLAWLALNASGAAAGGTVAAGIADPDPQVRRLALLAVPGLADTAVRGELLALVGRDPEAMVRYEWVVTHALSFPAQCGPVINALRDSSGHVVLAAIDALGKMTCAAPARAALLRVIGEDRAVTRERDSRGLSWHPAAHAIVALARLDPGAAAPLLAREAASSTWQARMYAARGAAIVRDTAILARLSLDPVGNVREAAIVGLSSSVGHLADRLYVRALASRDYQVVLAAARALAGTPVPDSVLPSVLVALDRITLEKRQNSRDPRTELLARVDEMADRRAVASLVALLADVDSAVGRRALAILERLDPGRHRLAARAARVDSTPIPLAPQRIRVVMSRESGGGQFEIETFPDAAPMTVARVGALVRAGYYDGLTYHRVVPNFVIQGGSPAMNEYVGAGDFMRDELGLAHHSRGTLGISTRGRDTGDAQWFVNLVDNFRLDHDYTVWGRVVAGMDVVDRILEGDTMESVRLIPAGQPPR